ncbi:hypothetical protein [Vibrio sp. 99-70-13A1]|uniref:hypothetical protein n=1 Tax=Vibrio sp. 99-70-13A1 TaxID=2607601 RepID=UPI0014937485|nr:hypothetical protein [Vibrio sp. 99-70-13A1]NOH99133.1 hypothetical protein [Vibrio sp. 99-70-13A1]
MKFNIPLICIALASVSASASDLHLSPELKIGAYHGFGIQAGITDIVDFDAIYLSYSDIWYETGRYDETVRAYRVGIQNMFGSKQIHGFQAEVGLADYDGEKTRSNITEKKTAVGLSLGGAYVYQANSTLALRAGADFNIFDHNKTFVPYNTTVNINLGAIIRF